MKELSNDLHGEKTGLRNKPLKIPQKLIDLR
jgi:hypothetical protein